LKGVVDRIGVEETAESGNAAPAPASAWPTPPPDWDVHLSDADVHTTQDT